MNKMNKMNKIKTTRRILGCLGYADIVLTMIACVKDWEYFYLYLHR